MLSYQSFKPSSGDCTGKDAMNPQPQLRILLVEGNGRDALTVQRALAQCFGGDFVLTHVERLADACNRIEAEKFDVVLLDLMLPDSSGLDTFLRLSRHEPRVPVLVLTGLEDEGEGIKATQQGAQDYLLKNQLQPPLLARAVRYAIERHQVAAELHESKGRLRIVTDTANVGLAAVDREHRYRYTNRAWAEFLELPTEDLVGQRMADRLGALYDDQIRRRLEMAFWGERVSHELVVSPFLAGPRETIFYGVLRTPGEPTRAPRCGHNRGCHRAQAGSRSAPGAPPPAPDSSCDQRGGVYVAGLKRCRGAVFSTRRCPSVPSISALSGSGFQRATSSERRLYGATEILTSRETEASTCKIPKSVLLILDVIVKKESIIVEDVPASRGLAVFKNEEVQSAILVPIMAAKKFWVPFNSAAGPRASFRRSCYAHSRPSVTMWA